LHRQWKKRRRSIVVKYEKAVQAEIIHLSKVDMSRRNAAERLVVCAAAARRVLDASATR
jgi:hypothetical protein